MMPGRIFGCVLAAGIGLTTAAGAKDSIKDRIRPAVQATCARASYPGDPVCDVGDTSGALPTPGSGAIRREAPQGLRVNEDISIRGRSDFNASRNGPIQFSNPNPHPGLQDVNGGGAVNYRF